MDIWHCLVLVTVLLLMPVNVLCEAGKWRLLLRDVEPIDIYFMEDEERALQADSADKRPKLMIRNMKVSMPVVNYNGSLSRERSD